MARVQKETQKYKDWWRGFIVSIGGTYEVKKNGKDVYHYKGKQTHKVWHTSYSDRRTLQNIKKDMRHMAMTLSIFESWESFMDENFISFTQSIGDELSEVVARNTLEEIFRRIDKEIESLEDEASDE